MEQEIDYSNHFCKGEKVWKNICFECQYPTEKDRQDYLLKKIKKQREIIAELTTRAKLSFEEKRAIAIFEEKENENEKLKDYIKYWISSFTRLENKTIAIMKIFKNRPYLKKKVEKILLSGSKKYNFPNYNNKLSILRNEVVKDDGGF